MVPCVSVIEPTVENSEPEGSTNQSSASDDQSFDMSFEYMLGSERLVLPSIDVQVLNCTNSHLSLFYGQTNETIALPPGFSVLNMTDSLEISVEGSNISELGSLGTHYIEVWETDWFTGDVAKTKIHIEVT